MRCICIGSGAQTGLERHKKALLQRYPPDRRPWGFWEYRLRAPAELRDYAVLDTIYDDEEWGAAVKRGSELEAARLACLAAHWPAGTSSER